MTATLTTMAGGKPGDFVTVRHLRAAGTHREIGRALAAAAVEVHGTTAQPAPSAGPEVELARRRWFDRNYPLHAERAMGVADHFALDPDDVTVCFDWLGTFEVPAGCSVAWYPGTATKRGHGLLSRNFDFPTATFTQLLGLPSPAGERPLAADPWVIELHPDDGYASVTVGIMDVMGAMDGINEAGLSVALLADNETPEPEPTGSLRVGVAEQQVVRYLLDTCATAAEARQALLLAKHYYFFTPCHYVVADRHGDAFVWEHSPRRNQEIIVPAAEGGLVCTNHLLHRWPDPSELPADDGPIGTAALTYRRWRTLDEGRRISPVLDDTDIREQFASVAFRAPVAEARTFWHALYDMDESSVELSFFARDESGESIYTEPARLSVGA